jgi:hypothetical protein
MTWTKRAKFLIQNLDLEAASGVDGARWEHFQLAHLNDDTILRCEAKSRQIAASFTFSAEAVANALLDNTSSLFQSINLDEAREKILYARSIYESLYMRGLPKITQPNTTTQLGFSNGARIISSPGTPQRGKARFWVYLDEWGASNTCQAQLCRCVPGGNQRWQVEGCIKSYGRRRFFLGDIQRGDKTIPRLQSQVNALVGVQFFSGY